MNESLKKGKKKLNKSFFLIKKLKKLVKKKEKIFIELEKIENSF